jgi:hypothetical protein
MSEMPHSRKYHSETVFVRRGNDLVVAHRAARLDYRRYAVFCGGIDAIAEREKSI